MRFAVEALLARGLSADRAYVSMERNMQCGIGHCGHCQLGPTLVCRDGPVYTLGGGGAVAGDPGAVTKPKLAVWKFASCDGCQLTVLDCEDELLALAGEIEVAYFPEASRAMVEGPYDVSLVEGSITTAGDAERIQEVRARLTSARDDRRVRDRGRHPGAAELRRRGRVRVDRLRATRVHLDARDVDADRRPRDRRLRTARLPDRQASAARGDQRAAPPPRAAGAVAQRLHRLQAARDGVRDGRPRHSVPRARSRTPAAARCAPPTTAGATAASGRWRRRTRGRSAAGWARSARTNGTSSASTGPSTRTPLRSGRRARRMSPASRTLAVDVLARVEGEGAMHVRIDGDTVADVQLRIYEPPRFFEAFLRGRAFTEVPGHHRAHLRHLPGRLPDELRAGDGGRVRRGDRRRPDPGPAAAALLRRVDREPRAPRPPAARARLPRLRERDRDGRRPPRDRRARADDEEDRQRADGGGRRARDPSDQRARRRLLPRSHTRRAAAAGRSSSSARARPRSRPCGGRRRCRSPTSSSSTSWSRCASTASTRSTSAGSCPPAGSTSTPQRMGRLVRGGARRPLERSALPHPRPRRVPRRPARALQPQLRRAVRGGARGGARGRRRADVPQPVSEHRRPQRRGALRMRRGAADHRRLRAAGRAGGRGGAAGGGRLRGQRGAARPALASLRDRRRRARSSTRGSCRRPRRTSSRSSRTCGRSCSEHVRLPDDELRHRCEQAIRNHDPCISCATHFLTLDVERT